jgi:hypothetical protein
MAKPSIAASLSFSSTFRPSASNTFSRGLQPRRRGIARLVLSTAAIQEAAVALYRSAGYRLVREDVSEMVSNKTVGSGLRRFHFNKIL